MDESPYYSRPEPGDHLHQGELLRLVWEWTVGYDHDESSVIVAGAEARKHRIAVILAQECNLVRDFEQRKENLMVETDLINVLLCPAEPADEVREKQKSLKPGKLWDNVRRNNNDRYQYLAEIPPDADAEGKGHAPLLVDFQSCFSVRTRELYRQFRSNKDEPEKRSALPFAKLNMPWREHLQQRFANYLNRIGLPREHFISETQRVQAADA